ncbi:hypothetical protein LAWI1_G001767 [Lachnellula willkommii]|uniref:Uncharacterized protein n=1 Tax=Lachnellula willkommii TaxID=215461 RepID=A0A559MH96_9HELO|nr:hypothetical protein LAWI1_G001767 [Lachnellula willkommii]
MAIPEVADALQALSISDPEPEYLLFGPTGERAWLQERHLRWQEGDEDNLVSWTSSLLFALVYVFHLHANYRDNSAFDDINLCIIDTDKFPKAVFLRDMDLIQVYSPFDADLKNFKGLRSRRDWYFGEYLSQGALKIENKCRIVSAQAMIDMGLYDLRHEFKTFSRWEISWTPPWAKPVIEFRKLVYQIEGSGNSDDRIWIAIAIARLFGLCWVLPMAANLGALLPPSEDNTAIIQAFSITFFTGWLALPTSKFKLIYLGGDASPLKTKVIAYDSLPEVEQFSKIMRSVYKDFCVRELRSKLLMANLSLPEIPSKDKY